MPNKFVIQAHFRGKHLSSVHLDYRFQHPKYKNFFFGFTQFVDKGTLEGTETDIDKERIEYAKSKLEQWDKYFKDPSQRRLGLRKSMGSIEWFKIDGVIAKRLSDTSYSQVMLKIAEGTYEIFEDRIYSIKISFNKVKTKCGVNDYWSDSTYIFRYLPFEDTRTPFSVLSWQLKEVDYSDNEFQYIKTLSRNFDVFESSTELNGHYLLKDVKSGKWYTVDRHPLFENVFALIEGRYQIGDNLDKLESKVPLTIDFLKTSKEYYYVGIKL